MAEGLYHVLACRQSWEDARAFFRRSLAEIRRMREVSHRYYCEDRRRVAAEMDSIDRWQSR